MHICVVLLFTSLIYCKSSIGVPVINQPDTEKHLIYSNGENTTEFPCINVRSTFEDSSELQDKNKDSIYFPCERTANVHKIARRETYDDENNNMNSNDQTNNNNTSNNDNNAGNDNDESNNTVEDNNNNDMNSKNTTETQDQTTESTTSTSTTAKITQPPATESTTYTPTTSTSTPTTSTTTSTQPPTTSTPTQPPATLPVSVTTTGNSTNTNVGDVHDNEVDTKKASKFNCTETFTISVPIYANFTTITEVLFLRGHIEVAVDPIDGDNKITFYNLTLRNSLTDEISTGFKGAWNSFIDVISPKDDSLDDTAVVNQPLSNRWNIFIDALSS